MFIEQKQGEPPKILSPLDFMKRLQQEQPTPEQQKQFDALMKNLENASADLVVHTIQMWMEKTKQDKINYGDTVTMVLSTFNLLQEAMNSKMILSHVAETTFQILKNKGLLKDGANEPGK